MDLLIDTNVLIDHFGNRGEFAEAAHKLFALSIFGDAALWVTPNSIIDAFYILKKVAPSHEIQQAFARSFKHLHVCSVAQEDLFTAISLQWNDLEDCLISVCAEKVKANYIVTRDASGFSQSSIQAIDTQTLIKNLAEETNAHYYYLEM